MSFRMVFTNDPDHGRTEDYRRIFSALDRIGLKITTAVCCTMKDDDSALAQHCYKGETHTLEDPEYRELMQEVKANGHEIAYHGYSQVSDTREEFLCGIEILTETFGEAPKTFIKHGGHFGHHKPGVVKKEDLSYEGGIPGSPYYVADIVESRFRWVWELHHLFDPQTGTPDPKIRSDRDIVYPRAKNFGFWRHRLGHLNWPDPTLPDKLSESDGVYMAYTHFGYEWCREATLEHWMGDDLDRTVETLAEIIETHDVKTQTVDQFCSEVVKKYDLNPFCR